MNHKNYSDNTKKSYENILNQIVPKQKHLTSNPNSNISFRYEQYNFDIAILKGEEMKEKQ